MTDFFSDLVWSMKHGDFVAWLLAFLLIVIAAFGVFGCVWLTDLVYVGEPIYYQAEIVDGLYKPDTRETNVMPVVGVGSNGQAVSAVAVSSSGSGEKFTLMVRDKRTMEVYAVTVTPTIFYNTYIGQTVRMSEVKGKILGNIHREVVQ